MRPGVRSPGAKSTLTEARMGPGFTSFGLRSSPDFPLDPFISLDDFRMSEPTFPPHPHAGFSAVTYLFEDSPGAFTNRDSLGDRSRIGPGALHWTQAGRGMMHEEIPALRGTVCHGLQMFVNLRADHKGAPPRAFHVEGGQVPEVVPDAGVRVRVLAGSFGGVHSPLTELLTPVLLLDIHLSPGARITVPTDEGWTTFLLSLSGSGVAGPRGSEADLKAHEAVGFRQDGDRVELAAGAGGFHVLVAGGRPLGEPLVFGGPFAGTTRGDIDAAYARYQRGEMGRLARSF
jgi:redox-sensitive bicupin YhaK (pirin superfamily)